MWISKRCNNTLFTRWKLKPVLVTGLVVWMGVYLYTMPTHTSVVRNVRENDGQVNDAVTRDMDTGVYSEKSIVLCVSEASENEFSESQHHSSYGHCQSEDFGHVGHGDKTSMTYFTDGFEVTQEPYLTWLNNTNTFCDDAVQIFNSMFGILRNVKVNPSERRDADSLAKGGESIKEVKSQNVQKEDYQFKQGFFEIACEDSKLSGLNSLNGYDRISQLKVVNEVNAEGYKVEEKFTIAIARGDYANLWNHMFELYGVFTMMMIFNKKPEEVNVLFLDGHPSCLLDRNWEHMFNVQRVGRLEQPVLYKNLVWGLDQKNVPLAKWKNPGCPYVEEFRTFVLNQYDIVEDAKKLNCQKLTFTFIVRRNQVYHPRNLEGDVQRKIFNELEVIETLMDKFPGVCIQALLMESIPMRAQMEIISETDVLIGMHGAGMMHTTFLPRHAGVVELFPRDWRKTRPFSIMFEVMSANWRKLKYGYWQNTDIERDFSDKITIVDTDRVYSEVKRVLDQMCQS